LVDRSGDKDRMRTMITWLGFRHVKYGVRPHHIPIMGQVRIDAAPNRTCIIEHLMRRIPY
jgi:hypothetical protein